MSLYESPAASDAIVERLERAHSVPLVVRHPQSIAHDAIVVDDEPVAQHRRTAELGEQRAGELLERVGEDHDLGDRAQSIEEVGGAVERCQPADHVGDLRESQVVGGEQIEPPAHEHVVVGLVAGRAPQCADPRALGDCDPDLGDEHTLEVEGNDRLAGVVHRVSGWSRRVAVPIGSLVRTCPNRGVARTLACAPWGAAVRSSANHAVMDRRVPSSTAMNSE